MEENKVEWKVLVVADNEIEASMVEGILKMAEIPTIRKLKGVDGIINVLIGSPIAGIDILVPEDRYKEAYELLHADFSEEDFQDQTE